MPKAASKNSKTRQVEQMIRLIGPMRLLMTTRYNIAMASASPILQAKRFCGAPTYSGVWFLTANRPTIMLGANFGLIRIRMVKSIRKAITNTFVIWKFPVSHAFMKAIMAKKNNIPALALTSRSLSTGTAYSSIVSPKRRILFMLFLSIIVDRNPAGLDPAQMQERDATS